MTTPSTSVVYTIHEEHKRKVNQISALVFEELSRVEESTGSGTPDLSKSIGILQNIMDQVKADCIADLRRRAQEHNGAVLISQRIPPEVLAEIVLYVICSERDRYYARLYDLRSVSKYWNNLIKSTPSMWTLLDCTSMARSGLWISLDFVKNAIRRSGTLPVHVTAHAAVSSSSFSVLLMGISSRWHDADVTLHPDGMLEFISRASFPKLMTLTIRDSPSQRVFEETDKCIRPCGSFPSLQRLRTNTVLLRPPEGFAALQTLIIEPALSSEILVIPCITLPMYLDCCPNLTELRIFNAWGFDEWVPEEANGPTVRLPHLRTLTIWDCDLGILGSLLPALKENSCKKLFVNLVSYQESRRDEWQERRQDCDVFELLGPIVPLIQRSCKEANCVELVLGPELFQLRTQVSASGTAGATQSVVIGLAEVAKPQAVIRLLDLLSLRDRDPLFKIHLRVSMNGGRLSEHVHRFKEEILLPILEWPSVTSLSIDMDEPNARVFLEDLRTPLRSGIWPLPGVTTLLLDDMNAGALSEELRLLYKWRVSEGVDVARLQSIVISSHTAWDGNISSNGLDDGPSDVLAERRSKTPSWKDSVPWTTF